MYSPIDRESDEIRLIILHPSSIREAEISCSLVRTSLSTTPQFEALSYEWGEKGGDQWILVNDLIVPIQKNLLQALHHVRLRDRERLLWIDALCINQLDKLEKNHQVKRMSQIYMTAWRTLIWLGPESQDSNLALRFMSFVGTSHRGGPFEELHVYNDYRRELESIRRLFQRTYWTRLWIIQEVLVANEALIQCGQEVLDWDLFSRCQEYLLVPGIKTPRDDKFNDLHESTAASLERHRLRYQQGLCSLRELLYEFSNSKCFDVRDTIYGLAGLANDASDLPIDYRKSAFDVFTDVIKLEVYENCETLVAFSQFLQRLLRGQVLRSVPGYESILITSSATALGYDTGTVAEFGPYYDCRGGSLRLNPINLELRTFLAQYDEKSYISIVDGLFFAGAKIIISNTVIPISRSRSFGLNGKRSPRHGSQPIKHLDRRSSDNLSPRSTSDLSNSSRKIGPIFFADSNGDIGLAPSNVRRSDVICRFEDSDIVAFLRQEDGQYSLIGRGVYPKWPGESNRPISVGSSKDFRFRVWRNVGFQERGRITLYLRPHTLQLLTQ